MINCLSLYKIVFTNFFWWFGFVTFFCISFKKDVSYLPIKLLFRTDTHKIANLDQINIKSFEYRLKCVWCKFFDISISLLTARLYLSCRTYYRFARLIHDTIIGNNCSSRIHYHVYVIRVHLSGTFYRYHWVV